MQRWFDKSVVYQIYPLSFKDSNGDGIGDIRGIIEKIDYLDQLGVDVLWLSPIYASPMDDNGYDISDYYEINPLFGTKADFVALLEAVHARGMKLIMDLVVNHTSDEHHWFIEAKSAKTSKYRDYYIFRSGTGTNPPGTERSVFGGSAWEHSEETGDYYFHMFSKKQPDLNWQNPKLRQEIYKMINYWLDLGVDGFRMDVIDLIGKEIDKRIYSNGPRLHEFLQEMHRACFLGRKTLTVGETGSVRPEIAKMYTGEGRNELDMVFQFEHVGLDQEHGKDKWHLSPLDVSELKRVLSMWQTELHNQGWNSLYWSNHDQPRIVSRWGNDEKYRDKSAKCLGAILHFMQGTPYIYQGEEIGMTNIIYDDFTDVNDIESKNMIKEKLDLGWSKKRVLEALNAKGRDNARTPFQWNDSLNAGFSTGKPWLKVNPNYRFINAETELQSKDSIFYFYHQLINLRKELTVVSNGSYELLLPDDPRIFAYRRSNSHQCLTLIANMTADETTYPVELALGGELLGNYENRVLGLLKAFEVQVYLKEKLGDKDD